MINWTLPGSVEVQHTRRYRVSHVNVYLPLPKVSQASKSADFNRGPEDELIPKYQVRPLGYV